MRHAVTWQSVTFNPALTPLRRSAIQIQANPAVSCRQVNDLLLRLQLSTGSRLHPSIVVFDWPKEPRELRWCVWVVQTNWFCFLSLMCTCECAYVHKLPVVHRKASYMEGNATRNAWMHTQSKPQTHIHNFDTYLGSCRQGDIEAVISLFISIWEQPSWHMFKVVWWMKALGKKIKVKEYQEREEVKHQETHEGDC